jgi:N-acetyl-1-D-myo-inositol-2-amino-2-deoxy-alpha-D-glucopyranoside deacetylase
MPSTELGPAEGARMLVVHAHPDDESITTGATIAKYADLGARVTVVTCTRGEQGEIIPPQWGHLTNGANGTLGAHRVEELAAAMRALGVDDHRFLDELPDQPRPPADLTRGAQRYSDSGMAFDDDGRVVLPDHVEPQAFATADLHPAAQRLSGLIVELEPHVVVTYDPGGGYGHPDHVRTHDVTMRAIELSAPRWRVPEVFWVLWPQNDQADHQPAHTGGTKRPQRTERRIVEVDARAWLDRKAAALRAHATQVTVARETFALSNNVDHPLTGLERFARASES